MKDDCLHCALRDAANAWLERQEGVRVDVFFAHAAKFVAEAMDDARVPDAVEEEFLSQFIESIRRQRAAMPDAAPRQHHLHS